jgi:hypothetical protein
MAIGILVFFTITRAVFAVNLHIIAETEPAGAGNGGIDGSFVFVVFFIFIGFRAVPDLFVGVTSIPQAHGLALGPPPAGMGRHFAFRVGAPGTPPSGNVLSQLPCTSAERTCQQIA